MSKERYSEEHDRFWKGVPEHSRLMESNGRDAKFAKNFFWQPPDEGKIFREHYSTERPDPYSIMPKELIKWLMKK